MTSPTTPHSPAQTSLAKTSGDQEQERPARSHDDRAATAPTELADLAHAQEDLTQEVRLHATGPGNTP